MRYVGLALLLSLLAVAGVLVAGWRPPYKYNPWATLDLRARPDWLTRFRLCRIGDDAGQCSSALSQAGASFAAIPDKNLSDGCGWHDAVTLRGTGMAKLDKPVVVTCPLAASLVLFDLHVIQPEAQKSFGHGVAVVEQVGSYNCRNVKGDDSNALSSHAQARAIDVTGFRLDDGRDITLARDWNRPGAGNFLHDTEQHAWGFFGVVLGPDYNAAHAGHLHLQEGSAGWCR